MDNRIYNVNGYGDEMLKMALALVFMQKGERTTCKSWKQTEEHGLILLWSDCDGANNFPVPIDSNNVFPIVKNWLKGDFASKVTFSEWCDDSDNDGHNEEGWQVYCEDWGHVAGNSYAICGIKPAFIWYGK